jgi:hypothetical protein
MQKGRESRLNGEREATKKESVLLATFAKVKEKNQKNYMANVNFHSVTPVWNESTKKGKRRFAFFIIIIFWALDIWQNFKDRNKNKRSQKKQDERSLAYIFFLVTIPTSPCTCREDIIVTDTTFYRLDAQTAVTTSAKKKKRFSFYFSFFPYMSSQAGRSG